MILECIRGIQFMVNMRAYVSDSEEGIHILGNLICFSPVNMSDTRLPCLQRKVCTNTKLVFKLNHTHRLSAHKLHTAHAQSPRGITHNHIQ